MQQKCPNCGNSECYAETVDIGVGEQQCSPFCCEICGWMEDTPDWDDGVPLNFPEEA